MLCATSSTRRDNACVNKPISKHDAAQPTKLLAPNEFGGGAPNRPTATHAALIRAEKSTARINSGKNAEEAAAQYLESKGYNIIARNLRLGHLEIDLLATLANTNLLIVIEVKARRTGTHAPELRVDWRKQRHLILAAQMLLSRRIFHGKQIQFDVIAVEMDQLQKPMNLRHIQRAFDANMR